VPETVKMNGVARCGWAAPSRTTAAVKKGQVTKPGKETRKMREMESKNDVVGTRWKGKVSEVGERGRETNLQYWNGVGVSEVNETMCKSDVVLRMIDGGMIRE